MVRSYLIICVEYWLPEIDTLMLKMISKSFWKCDIFNAMDGTDNDILWEDQTDDTCDTDATDIYTIVWHANKLSN